MESEYFKNCWKGRIWTFVIHFIEQLTIFYLDTYRRLTSQMIEFLKIISENKNSKIILVLEF
jgi:hypothetical protein